jgi:hypothetical protein
MRGAEKRRGVRPFFVSSNRISAVAKSFALKMLELNGQRLRALKEVRM